jgi:hypothetical protein
MNKCTGGSNAFEYSAAEWATSVSDDTEQLEKVTDSICYDPFDKLCMSYVAAKVNVHQLQPNLSNLLLTVMIVVCMPATTPSEISIILCIIFAGDNLKF